MIAGDPITHESAHLHVSGEARYADDVPLPADTLHGAFGTSNIAHGRVTSLDLAAVAAEARAHDGLVPPVTRSSPARSRREAVSA